MKPFIKWAGGKTQLLPEIKKRLPQNFGNYYEPFIGGGALLFDLEPEHGVINDVNEHLIYTYKMIRDNAELLMDKLDEMTNLYLNAEEKKAIFYQFRQEYNEKIKNNCFDLDVAALFIILNKTCFNGLYRVNSKGLYNVPANGRKTLKAYDRENLIEVSSFLKQINILNVDFEEACKLAEKGDFVFFDSPYAPLNPTSFETYTKEGFAVEEHRRLAELFKKLTQKGVYCMLTNHNTELINELYKDYKIDVVDVKRMINRDASNRVGEEVIITNY